MKTILVFLLPCVSQLIGQHDQFTINYNNSLQLHHDIAATAATNSYDLPTEKHDHTRWGSKSLQAGNYELQDVKNKFSALTNTQSSQRNVAEAILKNPGKFIVNTWLSYHFYSTSDPVSTLMMQIFDKKNQPVSPELQVSGSTQATVGLSPVLPLDNGDFILLWSGEEHGQYKIYGKRFGPSGIQKGPMFIISQSSILQTVIPHGMCEGNICVATWHAAVFNIKMQRFYVNGTLIGNKKTVNINTSDAQFYPKAFLPSENKYITWWIKWRTTVYTILFTAGGCMVVTVALYIR